MFASASPVRIKLLAAAYNKFEFTKIPLTYKANRNYIPENRCASKLYTGQQEIIQRCILN